MFLLESAWPAGTGWADPGHPVRSGCDWQERFSDRQQLQQPDCSDSEPCCCPINHANNNLDHNLDYPSDHNYTGDNHADNHDNNGHKQWDDDRVGDSSKHRHDDDNNSDGDAANNCAASSCESSARSSCDPSARVSLE